MNDTLKTIVGLLDTGKPELQVAAAQILGELHVKDANAVRALAHGLRRSPVLARFCIDALAKIATPEAIELVAKAAIEADSLGDHAAHLVGDLGAAAQQVLASAYGLASSDARKRILGLLGKHPTKEAGPVLVQALLSPEAAEHAARLVAAAREHIDPAVAKAMSAALGRHLHEPLPDLCLAHIVATLAVLDPDGSRNAIVGFTQPAAPTNVRAAAFRALRGSKLAAAQVRTMMDLLEDPAQKAVHDAVREVLAALPEVPDALVPVLKRLLVARTPEQRLFALRLLRNAGGADLAKVALKLLDHEDVRFRDAAADALAGNRQAIEPLAKFVTGSKDPQVAGAAAAILVRHGASLSPKFVRVLAEKAIKALVDDVRTADLLLDVVFAGAGPKIAPFLIERCIRIRRVHRSADALHVLARLTQLAPQDDEVRYQLAVTKLLHDASLPATESSAPGNSAMGFVATLLRAGYPLLGRLCKEPAVTPELLLKVANHFRGAVGPEQRFALELLQYLAKRTKGRAADDAKVALRSVGA
jgi:HEAT repeat protein